MNSAHNQLLFAYLILIFLKSAPASSLPKNTSPPLPSAFLSIPYPIIPLFPLASPHHIQYLCYPALFPHTNHQSVLIPHMTLGFLSTFSFFHTLYVIILYPQILNTFQFFS